jgi:hypothetical protein
MSRRSERSEVNEVQAFLMQAADRLFSLETTSATGKSILQSVRKPRYSIDVFDYLVKLFIRQGRVLYSNGLIRN